MAQKAMLIVPIFNFIYCRCAAFRLQRRALLAVVPALEDRSSSTRQERSHSIHIVRQVSESDFGPSSCNSYGSQYRITGLLRLHAEDMFNSRANSGPASIASLFGFGQFAIPAAFTLNVFAKTVLLQALQPFFRPIRRIRPDVFAGVLCQNLFKYIAVMLRSICYGIVPNQLVTDINRDMIFVTEKRLAVLLGPAGINILSFAFVLWPILGDFALLYPNVLFTAIALLGNADNAGINNLALHRHKSVVTEMRRKWQTTLPQLQPQQGLAGNVRLSWHQEICGRDAYQVNVRRNGDQGSGIPSHHQEGYTATE